MKKAGIDIDGVLGDIVAVSIDYLKKVYDIDLRKEDITEYDFLDKIGLDRKEAEQLFLNSKLYENEPLIPGCGYGLQSLKELGYELNLVTFRDTSLTDITLSWLDRNKVPFDRIIFSNTRSKKDIAKDFEFDIFIEDRYETCVDLSGIVSCIYLLDAPYNKGKLEPGMIRVKSWIELIDIETI